MNKQLPWMPLDITGYLQDTGHLSTIEHGAYMLLIMEYWKHGGLPDDERKIARLAKMTTEQWAEHRDVLADLFLPGWKHKRVDAELARAAEVVEQRKNAGRDAARKRWAKQTHSAPMPDASQADNETIHTNTNQVSASLRSADTRDKRAVRLPANWKLPEGWGKDAIDAGLPANLIDLEAARMRDWSLSNRNGACKDWRARWRNWCREAVDRLGKGQGPPKRANQLSDAFGAMRQSPDDRPSETVPDPVRYLPAASG